MFYYSKDPIPYFCLFFILNLISCLSVFFTTDLVYDKTIALKVIKNLYLVFYNNIMDRDKHV